MHILKTSSALLHIFLPHHILWYNFTATSTRNFYIPTFPFFLFILFIIPFWKPKNRLLLNCFHNLHQNRLKWTLTHILSLYTPNMIIFLRFQSFLWFLDFENPSINTDFITLQIILVKSAKITCNCGILKIT